MAQVTGLIWQQWSVEHLCLQIALQIVFLMNSPGLSAGREQCCSSQPNTVLQNSSTLTVDTMLLYSSKSWRIKTLNWNASQGSQQILRRAGQATVNADHLACVVAFGKEGEGNLGLRPRARGRMEDGNSRALHASYAPEIPFPFPSERLLRSLLTSPTRDLYILNILTH